MSDIIQQLEFVYHARKAANPEWQQLLWDFLINCGCEPDDIWEYSPQIGRDAKRAEPDWL